MARHSKLDLELNIRPTQKQNNPLQSVGPGPWVAYLLSLLNLCVKFTALNVPTHHTQMHKLCVFFNKNLKKTVLVGSRAPLHSEPMTQLGQAKKIANNHSIKPC